MKKQLLITILLTLLTISCAYATRQGATEFVGNVGIGSLSPIQRLDVQGTIRTVGFNLSTSPTNNYVLTSDANGNGTWQAPSVGGSQTPWASDINGGGFKLTNTGNVSIGTTASSNLLTVGVNYLTVNASTNNVGIGVSNPTVTLDINNPNSAVWLPVMNMFATSNTGGGNATEYRVGVANSTGNSAEIRYVYQGSNNSSNRIDYSMNGNANAAISYNNNLNVGINNQSPGYTLDITGQEHLSSFLYLDSAISLQNNQAVGWGGNPYSNTVGVSGYSSNSTGDNVVISAYNKGQLDVQGNGGTDIGTYANYPYKVPPANGMAIAGNLGIGTWVTNGTLDVEGTLSTAVFNGNIGIGSFSPGDRLDVNGTIIVRGNLAGGTTGNVGIGTTQTGAGATCDSSCNTTNKRCFGGIPLTGGFKPCSASIVGDCICLSTS